MDKFFKITERGSTLATEIIAGITTFLTMAYIIFVNPNILTVDGNINPELWPAFFMATCVGAAVMSILMGLWANRPIALASGMGLNAVVAYGLIAGMQVDWRVAMSVIFLEGVIILICVVAGLREAVMNAIPVDLRRAIGVGIGLFVALIGLKGGGLVIANEATLISMGDLTSPPVFVAVIGLAVTAVLMAYHVKGDILIGILVATFAGWAFNIDLNGTPMREVVSGTLSSGIFNQVDFATSFATFGAPFQMVDGSMAILKVLTSGSLLLFVFSILMTDFFDTMGTVVAVGEEAGFVSEDGEVEDVKPILLVDSIAAAFGGLIGASSITSYVESGSGVSDGGRTGLSVVVTGVCFLLAIFLMPIIGFVPAQATAGALVIVGCLMCAPIRNITWSDFELAFPSFITLIMIPLTYSITNGIGLGFIAFVLIKLFRGKLAEIKPLMWVAAIAFLAVFLQPLYAGLIG